MKQLSLLFLTRDQQILLAMKKRGFGAGYWNGVGGKQKEDEAIEQTTARECQEEIGVQPKRLEKVGELVFCDSSGEDMLVSAFLCNDWIGEPVESEEMRPQWFGLDQVPYHQMWECDSHWLPAVLNGEKVKGLFKFEAEKLIDWQLNAVPEFA